MERVRRWKFKDMSNMQVLLNFRLEGCSTGQEDFPKEVVAFLEANYFKNVLEIWHFSSSNSIFPLIGPCYSAPPPQQSSLFDIKHR